MQSLLESLFSGSCSDSQQTVKWTEVPEEYREGEGSQLQEAATCWLLGIPTWDTLSRIDILVTGL